MDVHCQSNNSYVRWVTSFHLVDQKIMLQMRENRSEVNSQHCCIQSCSWKLLFQHYLEGVKKGVPNLSSGSQQEESNSLHTHSIPKCFIWKAWAKQGKKNSSLSMKGLIWSLHVVMKDFDGLTRNRFSWRAVNSNRDVLREKKMKCHMSVHLERLAGISWRKRKPEIRTGRKILPAPVNLTG